MSASCSPNQSKKPLLVAERMPLALKLMMRIDYRKRRTARQGYLTAPSCSRRGVRLPLRRRRAGRARRQDRVLDPRLFAGQGAQERGDLRRLVVRDLAPKLRGAHDRHRLLQVPDLAGAEVRRGQLHVAQRRGAEHVLVGGGGGDLEPALVALGQDVGARALEHAEREVALAAEVDAVVARGAAGLEEQPQALDLGSGHGAVVTLDPAVE